MLPKIRLPPPLKKRWKRRNTPRTDRLLSLRAQAYVPCVTCGQAPGTTVGRECRFCEEEARWQTT